jgi:nucleotide-binding universal stress UspA family protein
VSPFPTKILLATDGSKEAALAARSATDLADKTESELHVVYVEPWPPIIDPEADERVTEAITEKKMKRAKKFVDAQVQEIEAAGAPWRRPMPGREERPKRSSRWPKR